MNIRGILIAASLLAAIIVGPAFSQDQKAEAELTSLIRKLVAAQTAFDASAMEQILSADYIEISPAGEVDDRAKVLGFYSPAAKAAAGESPAVQLDEFKIRSYKDHASVIVRESFQRKMGEQVRTIAMRASFLCRKEQGRWVIAAAQYTGIRSPSK